MKELVSNNGNRIAFVFEASISKKGRRGKYVPSTWAIIHDLDLHAYPKQRYKAGENSFDVAKDGKYAKNMAWKRSHAAALVIGI